MKLRKLIIVAISLLCVLTITSCAPESPELPEPSESSESSEPSESPEPSEPSELQDLSFMGNGEGTETIVDNPTGNDVDTVEFFLNKVENTRRLSDILTDEYAIEDLAEFFGRASENEEYSGSKSLDVRIAAANEKFPIECLRQTDSGSLYSVYKVKEGGFYYVFWIIINDSEDYNKTVDWSVYFTAYLPTSIKLTQDDFNSIIPNSSTAEDVAVIDPNFELCFYLSRAIVSSSLLEDGSVMEICYDLEKLGSRADLIVTSKEIVSRAVATSRLAAVYPYDLP